MRQHRTYPSFLDGRGATLVEVLIGIVIIVLGSIGTLSFFSYGLGSVNKQGNRRAALERARQRLEQLLAEDLATVKPSDSALYYLTCDDNTGACGPLLAADPNEVRQVDQLQGQKIVSTVQCQTDVQGTPCDVLEFAVKVWFVPGPNVEDNFHRVHLRTLRSG